MLARYASGESRSSKRSVPGGAGGGGSGGGSRAISPNRSRGRGQPGAGRFRAGGVGEREQVDVALGVVEGDQPVAEHQRRVRQRRGVRRPAPALGLELEAEVAGEAAR